MVEDGTQESIEEYTEQCEGVLLDPGVGFVKK